MISTDELVECDRADLEADQWFVCRTRSRCEKALVAELNSKGIECFLPLGQQVRFHGNRKTIVSLPLIPGYVFLHGTVEESYFADRSDRTVQLIKVSDQRRLSWELKNLRDATERGAELMAYAGLVEGTLVEIRSGPLRGIQGVVDKRLGNRFVLQISALGQALSLEIDASILDRVN